MVSFVTEMIYLNANVNRLFVYKEIMVLAKEQFVLCYEHVTSPNFLAICFTSPFDLAIKLFAHAAIPGQHSFYMIYMPI